jgi:hypothetical protein
MVKKENERDPWDFEFDSNKVGKYEDSYKMSGSGLLCPKRNRSIGKPCHVCDAVQELYKYPEGSQERKVAQQKGAKWEYYICAVFPHNKEKAVIVKLGKKVGQALVEGIKLKGWNDIANPKAGKGREIRFTKTKGDGGNPSYSVDPVLDKATWDVPKKVLDNIPNIVDDPVKTVTSAAAEDIFDVKTMKFGETIVVRMLPPAADSIIKDAAHGVIFKHYGVTQDEIDGKIPMSRTLTTFEKGDNKEPTAQKEEVPWKEEPTKQEESAKQDAPPSKKRPACFGRTNFFDESSSSCTECPEFKDCGKEVMKNN